MNDTTRTSIAALTCNKACPKVLADWIDIVYQHLEKAHQRIGRHSEEFARIEIDTGIDTGEVIKSFQSYNTLILPFLTGGEQPETLANYLNRLLDQLDRDSFNILVIENHPASKAIPMESADQRYVMYGYNAATDVPSLLSPDYEPANYWSKITDIGYDIAKSPVLAGGGKASGPVKTVYVAEPVEEIHAERDQLTRELRQQNIRIMPDRPFNRGLELESQVFPLMQASDIIIEMVGEYDDDDATLTETQHELAARVNQERKSDALIPRLIWINPTVRNPGDSYLSFVGKMQKGGEHMRGAEVVQAPIEILKSILRKVLTAESISGKKEEGIGKGEIYLVHDRQDNELAKQVKEVFEASGIAVVDPWIMDDLEGLYRNHKRYLMSSDALLILYSGNNLTWLTGKFRDVLKAPGYGRMNPFIACGVLNVSREEMVEVPGIEVIRAKSDLSLIRKALDPFIEKIKSNHGK